MATGLTIIVQSCGFFTRDCVTNMLSLGLNSTCSVIVVLAEKNRTKEFAVD